MRRHLALLVVASVIAALSMGCAGSASEEDSDSSEDALSAQTLTAAACKTPNLRTKAQTAGGAAIPGTAITSIAGCIVGKNGETGKNVSGRLVTLLGDTAHIAQVRTADGERVFAKFNALAPSGSLATNLVQDVDVTLQMVGSPSARLRITRRLSAAGVYSLHIENVTPFRASLFFVPVTAIEVGDLTLDVQMNPEANGLSVTGAGSVKLEVMQDQAAGASALVGDVFAWLRDELAR